MKLFHTVSLLSLISSLAFGGTSESRVETVTIELNPRSFELAVASGYLFGAINPPADYQIGAENLTARIRWRVVRRDSWLRGFNQVYVCASVEPISSLI